MIFLAFGKEGQIECLVSGVGAGVGGDEGS